MITLSLHAPQAWEFNVRAAAADWPAEVRLHHGEGAPPSLVASIGGPTSPIAHALDVTGAGAEALLYCRAPLPPERLTSWARRSLCRLPTARTLDWPTPEIVHETALPSDSSAVRTTRREISTLFRESPRVDDLVLAASELAANAVQHGHGPTSLTVTTGAGSVVIEVGDHAPGLLPAVLPLRPNAASGRGLAIVNVICDCWGVLALADSKIVWCEFLDADSTVGARPRR